MERSSDVLVRPTRIHPRLLVKTRHCKSIGPGVAKQNQGAEGFIATGPKGAETAAASKAAAIKGMEEMAAKFRETGSELYMGAGDRGPD